MTKDPKPPGPFGRDEADRWRGKVRVQSRGNASGWVEYCAQYRLNAWVSFDWLPVENLAIAKGIFVFYKFEDAKTAAQLKWNAVTAEQKQRRVERFSAWRKVWP